MGRLSEYDDLEQTKIKQAPGLRLPESVLIVGQAPAELRWEDLDERWKEFYGKLSFILSAPEE